MRTSVLTKLSIQWTRFLKARGDWSIGVYTGDSPLNLAPASHLNNPVLTALDVTDAPAVFVADPFMIRVEQTFYMFFEVMCADDFRGNIGLAVSDDGFKWDYRGIVLREPFHLSYPYVFAWRGEYYMVPETKKSGSVRIYKALSFPNGWALCASPLKGALADPSILRYEDRWWLFAAQGKGTLRLYHAEDLFGIWHEHPRSPIVTNNANAARPAGRVITYNDQTIRYAQNARRDEVRAFAITKLTTSFYEEKECLESPVLRATGRGWNSKGTHHLDPHRLDEGCWIACVDGF
jgi:hypothetical protein